MAPMCDRWGFWGGKGFTLIPALRHLPTASGTAARGGSIMDMSPTKQRLFMGKLISSVLNLNPLEKVLGRFKKQNPGERQKRGLIVHFKAWKIQIKPFSTYLPQYDIVAYRTMVGGISGYLGYSM